ncbi:hypothetical protein D3C81_1390940 [compost metagenome]
MSDNALARIGAVADILVRLLGAAAIVVVARRVGVARPREDIVQVRRAEAGAIGAAEHQGLDRAIFQTEIVGELAEALVRELVVIIATGRAELEVAEQRRAQLIADAPVVAVALAV